MDHTARPPASDLSPTRRVSPVLAGVLIAGIAFAAVWLANGATRLDLSSSAHAASMQVSGGSGKPVYSSRELADAELAVLDAETVLAHWNAEIELCSRMVDQLASLANEDVSGKARLSPYPGMLSKALNARQDATLALARSKGRFEAMKRINAEAMMLAPSVSPPTGR
jgi:hypothetical protein